MNNLNTEYRKLAQKEYKTKVRLGGEGDQLGTVQEI